MEIVNISTTKRPITFVSAKQTLQVNPVVRQVTLQTTQSSVTIQGKSKRGLKGDTGDRGPVGPAGPSNSLSIGTVATGAAGSSAEASITGESPSQALNLTIPRGDKGETGDTGPANELSIGTVTTGGAGTDADASITGDSPSQTLNLTIPKGDTGATGATGAKGDKGDKGDTGATGATGAKGDTGDAATVEVNSTLTGNPGTDATVSNSGDEHDAKLNFIIPAGAVWHNGATAPSITYKDGDYYLDTSSGDVYQQSSGSWDSPIANLTGPQGSAGAASGLDTQIQFNDGGAFAGSAGLTYNKSTHALTVTGAIAGLNLSGTNTGDQTTITGNAGTATKLQTARNINGVAFDGSANITIADSTKVPTSRTVNGHALSANVTVSKSDVGLGNVDNTSDVNKPVSTAQQTALDAKQDSSTAVTTNTTQTIPGDKTFNGTVDLSGASVNFPDKSVKASNVDFTTLRLGKAERTSPATFTNAISSPGAIAGLSVTFTLQETHTVRATFNCMSVYGATYIILCITNGPVNASNIIGQADVSPTATNLEINSNFAAETTLDAGTYTFNVGAGRNNGTGTINAATTSPAFLTVEIVE